MWKEFREFAIKGNAIDLAIGVVLGAAFGGIVKSLVDDVIMPPVGKIVGGVDFSNLFLVLGGGTFASLKAAKEAGAATLNYGIFLNTLINFLIVAFAVFLVVHQVNRWTKKPEVPGPPTTKDCPQCAMAIPLAAKRCGHCTSQLA